MSEYTVSMSSKEYGVEYFEYETREEALEGFDRLFETTKQYTEADGIVRQVAYLGTSPQERRNE